MASNGWLAAMLPLVPGLGPRKAQSLLQAVQAQEFALTRISLWNDIWKPGNAVFRSVPHLQPLHEKLPSLHQAFTPMTMQSPCAWQVHWTSGI